MVPLQNRPFEANVPDEALLGLVLILLAIFGGMYAFVRISQYRRQSQIQTVGPHVIIPITEEYGNSPWTIYRCKYCDKERERKDFFRYEDCGEFRAPR